MTNMAKKIMKILALISIISYVLAYPDGAPIAACSTQGVPQHGAPVLSGSDECTFSISPPSYSPGFPVTIEVTGKAFQFMGIFARVRDSSKVFYGTFTPGTDGFTQVAPCRNPSGSAITHTNNNLKTSIRFMWKAPSQGGLGNLTLDVVIVQSFDTIYRFLTPLPLTVSAFSAPATTTTTAAPQTSAPATAAPSMPGSEGSEGSEQIVQTHSGSEVDDSGSVTENGSESGFQTSDGSGGTQVTDDMNPNEFTDDDVKSSVIVSAPFPITGTSVSLELGWTSPDDAIIIGYDLEIAETTTPRTEWIKLWHDKTPHVNVSGLDPKTTYMFRVRGYTQAGPGEWSPVTEWETLPNVTKSWTPDPVTAASVSATSMELQWTPVTDLTVFSYIVEMREGTDPDWKIVYNGTDVTTTVDNLKPGMSYDIQLIVNTLGSQGGGSQTASFVSTFTTKNASTCPADCTGHGECDVSTGSCQCEDGFIGTECSLPATSLCSGKDYCMYWTVQVPYIYMRLKALTQNEGWLGLMLGAQENMLNGDALTFVVAKDSTTVWKVTAVDRWSKERALPQPDMMQNIEQARGYQVTDNATGDISSVVEFRRLLDTGDVYDHPIPSNGSIMVGFAYGTWTCCSHEFTTQQLVDFGTGVSKQAITVKPTLAKNPAFPLFIGFMICCVGGLFLQTSFGTTSAVGRVLRKKIGRYPEATWIDKVTFDIRPAFLDLSIGELAVVLTYIITIIQFGVITRNNYILAFNNPDYTWGRLAVIHLALTFLPVTRNGLWTHVFGISYERAIKFHRWIARVTWACIFAHFITQYQKNHAVYSSTLPTTYGYGTGYGFISFIFFTAMVVFAFEPIRRKSFEVFLASHVLCFPFAMIFAIIHNVELAYYTFLPLTLLYLIDWVIRCYQQWTRKIVVADLKTVSECSVLTLRVTDFKFTPGDYCFLNIPNISRFEYHPFSISSGPLEHEISFHILNMGSRTWTGKLYNSIGADHKDWKVRMEGPYGRISYNPANYQVVVLCAGGVGATPLMAILSQLHYLYSSKAPKNFIEVHLIWSSKHMEALEQWWPHLLERVSLDQDVFKLHLYCTEGGGLKRTPSPVTPVEMTSRIPQRQDTKALMSDDLPELQPQENYLLKIERGRPAFGLLFQTLPKVPPSQVVVLACGPQPMIAEAQRHAAARGFNFHKETFFL